MSVFHFLPEFILLLLGIGLLMIDAFSPASVKNRWAGKLSILTCIALCFFMVQSLELRSLKIDLYQGQWLLDHLAQWVKPLILFGVALISWYALEYWSPWKLDPMSWALFAFMSLGLCCMVSSEHGLTLYLGSELVSLPLCVLIIRTGRADKQIESWALEAGMKYLMLGALASALLLLGFSFMYGLTGSLSFEVWSDWLVQNKELVSNVHKDPNGVFFIIALISILCAVCFKLGVAPFHFWLPDVYQGSVYGVGLILCALPKLAVFVMAYRLFNVFGPCKELWQFCLLGLGLISVAWGNLAALLQVHVKRLLAYSSISNMGFVLLGLAHFQGWLGLNYLMAYVLVIVLVFAVLAFLSRVQQAELQYLSDLKGLSRRYPCAAALLLWCFLNLMGIPPSLGFYVKYLILEDLLRQGFVKLTGVLGILSVVGAYYYLKLIWYMYFEETDPLLSRAVLEPRDEKAPKLSKCSQNKASCILLGFHAVFILCLTLDPSPLYNLAKIAFID